MNEFKFNVGDEVKDVITGFKGIVTCRTQWLNNCNTYGVQQKKLKDGIPLERVHLDEPQLKLVKKGVLQMATKKTGGPERKLPTANR